MLLSNIETGLGHIVLFIFTTFINLTSFLPVTYLSFGLFIFFFLSNADMHKFPSYLENSQNLFPAVPNLFHLTGRKYTVCSNLA